MSRWQKFYSNAIGCCSEARPSVEKFDEAPNPTHRFTQQHGARCQSDFAVQGWALKAGLEAAQIDLTLQTPHSIKVTGGDGS